MEGRRPAVLFSDLLHGRWGLSRPEGRASDYATRQGVNYVDMNSPENYGIAWVVRDVRMSSSNRSGNFPHNSQLTATLVFSAGPNASNGGTLRGSRQRTRSWSAVHNATFFERSIRKSVEATLDAMMAEGVAAAFLARTG